MSCMHLNYLSRRLQLKLLSDEHGGITKFCESRHDHIYIQSKCTMKRSSAVFTVGVLRNLLDCKVRMTTCEQISWFWGSFQIETYGMCLKMQFFCFTHKVHCSFVSCWKSYSWMLCGVMMEAAFANWHCGTQQSENLWKKPSPTAVKIHFKFLLLTCSLLQKLNNRISRCGKFQRLFIWVCEWWQKRQERIRTSKSGKLWDNDQTTWFGEFELVLTNILDSTVWCASLSAKSWESMRVKLTFGGDHQLAGQSQRSHRVLVHESRETTCKRETSLR